MSGQIAVDMNEILGIMDWINYVEDMALTFLEKLELKSDLFTSKVKWQTKHLIMNVSTISDYTEKVKKICYIYMDRKEDLIEAEERCMRNLRK
jgi:hypothetical protein